MVEMGVLIVDADAQRRFIGVSHKARSAKCQYT